MAENVGIAGDVSVHATASNRLNIKAFGVAAALVWGFGLFFLTWWIIAFDGVTRQPTLISQVYRGYNLSPVGSLIGLLWATPDGLISGIIFAWLYNTCAKHIG